MIQFAHMSVNRATVHGMSWFPQFAETPHDLQELQAEIQAIEARQPPEQADIDARIAELMQLTDPQQLAAAMAALSEAIQAGSSAAEAVHPSALLAPQHAT